MTSDSSKIRWLSEADVRRTLDLPSLVDAMEAALVAFSGGRVTQPVRSVVRFGLEMPRFFGLMAAWAPEGAALGVKLVTVVPENLAAGLPTHQAVIVLFDQENGRLLAVLDGRYITEVRTPAVSLLSVRHLARRDAHRLAILGCGVQARSHLAYLRGEQRFDEVRAWDPDSVRLECLAAERSGGVAVRMAATAEDAVRSADVVVVATSSVTPVLQRRWVAPGTHLVAIGACRPDQRELDPRLVADCRLFVDSRAAALVESGDIVMAIAEGHFGPEHIAGELGEVIAGAVPGRTSESEITVFKSLGLAIEDVAAAGLAYRAAAARGIGLELEL